ARPKRIRATCLIGPDDLFDGYLIGDLPQDALLQRKPSASRVCGFGRSCFLFDGYLTGRPVVSTQLLRQAGNTPQSKGMTMSHIHHECELERHIVEQLAAAGWLVGKSADYDQGRALFPEDVLGWLE